jgi:cytochrome P450
MFSFNPFDESTRRDPYPLYTRARREQPVYAHPELPVFSVFGYADCHAILKDPETFSSVFPPLPGIDAAKLPQPSMLGQDPPEHTRLRGLVNQAFTPRIIRRLQPRAREIAKALLDEALQSAEVDLVAALTYPLPVIVIAEIIGVPSADRAQFKAWSDLAVANLGNGIFVPPTAKRLGELARMRTEMTAYFAALADERRRRPGEDLLTGLVQAEVEGSRLSHDEMISMLILILVAGNETTTNLIGNAVLELLDCPDEPARLRADQARAAPAIEEVLRHSSPVQMDPRRTTRPVEIHGQRIEAGRFVVSWLGSANRDETVFHAPDRFEVGRKDNHHLAFGFGPHYCLGANLARLEATVAVQELLARTKSFERTGDDPLPLHPSIVFRGVTELPVRLVPA